MIAKRLRFHFFLTTALCFIFIVTSIAQTDSIIGVNISQIRKANQIFIDRTECRTLLDSLSRQVGSYEVLHQKQSELIISLNKHGSYQEHIIDDKDAIINNDEKQLSIIGKNTKMLKLERNGLFLLSIGLAVKILITH